MYLIFLEPTIAYDPPFGPGIPGYAEVLRFNHEADEGGDIGNDEMEYWLYSTDRSPNGWNRCSQLADETKWNVYNLDNPALPLFGDWTFSTEDGTDCSLAPDEPLVYAWLSNIGDVAPAGDTTIYSVYVNTTGASPSYNDEVHLSLVDLAWYDGNHPRLFDGRYIEDLPVEHDEVITY